MSNPSIAPTRGSAVALFLLSATVLYLELVLIRWLPSNLYLLGYYKNVVLIACFLGLGLGYLRAERSAHRLPWIAAWLAGLTVVTTALHHLVIVTPWDNPNFIWPQTVEEEGGIQVPLLVIVVGAFLAVTATFIPLGAAVTARMRQFPPLRGYAYNLGGSLAGCVAFLVTSFLRVPPVVWFALSLGVVLWVVGRKGPRLAWALAGVTLAAVLVMDGWSGGGLAWSPYYKLHVGVWPDEASIDEESPGLEEPHRGAIQLVEANDSGHQLIMDLSDEVVDPEAVARQPLVRQFILSYRRIMYDSPYDFTRPESVLILGAGTGNEVAAALRHGIERIVAVELDPVIQEMGAERHPERPYDSPNVEVVIGDARAYLRRSTEKFDLIVFGSVDSLSSLTALTQVRLDNFLYTEESFREAFAHLEPDGVVQVVFYALRPEITGRLRDLMRAAGERDPWIYVVPDPTGQARGSSGVGLGAVASEVLLLSGPGLPAGPPIPAEGLQAIRLSREESGVITTDDWPFLYLPGPELPAPYLLAAAVLFAISAAWLRIIAQPSDRPRPHFFLFGLGFLLLETRSLVVLALIAGSTWFVASIVFIGFLGMAWVANAAVERFQPASKAPWILALLVALGINLVVPVSAFLHLPFVPRVILAAVMVSLPILFASTLFSLYFRESDDVARDLSANVLGAVAGGLLEYLSMLTGYRALLWIVIGAYALAVLTARHVPGRRVAESGS